MDASTIRAFAAQTLAGQADDTQSHDTQTATTPGAGATQANTTPSGTAQSGTAQPNATRTYAAQDSTAQANPAQANPAQANAAQGNAAQANAAQGNAAQASAAQASAAQGNATEAGAARADSAQSPSLATAGGGDGGVRASGGPAVRAAELAAGGSRFPVEASAAKPQSSTVDDVPGRPRRQPVHLESEAAVTPAAPLPAPVLPGPGAVDVPVAAPAFPVGVATQVSRRLVPLRRGPDGTHRLTIRLNPEGLGPISVVAQVRKGAIAVQITGGTEAGRAALQATLPDLRRDLMEAGFGSCSLDVQQGGPQPGQQGSGQASRESRQDRRPHRAAEPVEVAAPVEKEPGMPHRALDLRV
jgi:flagellar hook-length control protein FliK